MVCAETCVAVFKFLIFAGSLLEVFVTSALLFASSVLEISASSVSLG